MQATNQTLYQYHLEAQQISKSFQGFLLSSRVRDFYKHNKIRLESLFEKMNGLQQMYFVQEGGKTKETKDEKGVLMPVMLEGKTFEQFQAALKELMDVEINIIG